MWPPYGSGGVVCLSWLSGGSFLGHREHDLPRPRVWIFPGGYAGIRRSRTRKLPSCRGSVGVQFGSTAR
jgi:hypothetical protein